MQTNHTIQLVYIKPCVSVSFHKFNLTWLNVIYKKTIAI